MLCTFLRSLVSNMIKEAEEDQEVSVEDILYKFVDDQDYYLKINNSRFPFLEKYLADDEFLNETREYIKACKRYYDYKKSQAPIIAKQKAYEKKKRKFLQELKMSKEPPTKKQLYYYNRLCKKYNIEKKDVETMSKLSMRDELDRIINEHSRDCTNINKERN